MPINSRTSSANYDDAIGSSDAAAKLALQNLGTNDPNTKDSSAARAGN